jgi:hypothetical protein
VGDGQGRREGDGQGRREGDGRVTGRAWVDVLGDGVDYNGLDSARIRADNLLSGVRLGLRSWSVSTTRHPFEDLIIHLTRTTALGPGEAARVVADVLAYFGEPVEEYVRRRHGELKARGLTNDEIFPRISAELSGRRVAAPELSLRQLRRIVYG